MEGAAGAEPVPTPVKVAGVFKISLLADQRLRQELATRDIAKADGAGQRHGWEDLFGKYKYDETARRLDEAWFSGPVHSLDDLYGTLRRAVLCNASHPFGCLVDAFCSQVCTKYMGTALTEEAVEEIKSFTDALEALLLATYSPILQERMAPILRLTTIYECIFPRIDTVLTGVYSAVHGASDAVLDAKFVELGEATPAHCFNNKKFFLEGEQEPYGPAIARLKQLSSTPSPIGKLQCLVDVFNLVIENIVAYYDKLGRPVPDFGADSSWPIFQYVLIKAAVPRFFSAVALMRDFLVEDQEGGFSYRLMVAESTLDLLLALRWGNVDKDGVLFPVEQ